MVNTFYFSNNLSSFTIVSPPHSWDKSGAFQSYDLTTGQLTNSSETPTDSIRLFNTNSGNGFLTDLNRIFVSPSLLGQTFSGIKISGQIQAFASGNAIIRDSIGFSIVNSGGTVTHDLGRAASNLFDTSGDVNRSIFQISVGATFSVSSGDRLVVEVGAQMTGNWVSGNYSYRHALGAKTGTLLPIDNTTVLSLIPWISSDKNFLI